MFFGTFHHLLRVLPSIIYQKYYHLSAVLFRLLAALFHLLAVLFCCPSPTFYCMLVFMKLSNRLCPTSLSDYLKHYLPPIVYLFMWHCPIESSMASWIDDSKHLLYSIVCLFVQSYFKDSGIVFQSGHSNIMGWYVKISFFIYT